MFDHTVAMVIMRRARGSVVWHSVFLFPLRLSRVDMREYTQKWDRTRQDKHKIGRKHTGMQKGKEKGRILRTRKGARQEKIREGKIREGKTRQGKTRSDKTRHDNTKRHKTRLDIHNNQDHSDKTK
jgi:hypothetical protein